MQCKPEIKDVVRGISTVMSTKLTPYVSGTPQGILKRIDALFT